MLRSTLYAHFSESLSGLTTIRAYGATDRFIKENARLIDIQDRAYLLIKANERWLTTRLDWLGGTLVFATGVMCAAGSKTIGANQVAVCLTYMVTTTAMLSSLAAVATEIENSSK